MRVIQVLEFLKSSLRVEMRAFGFLIAIVSLCPGAIAAADMLGVSCFVKERNQKTLSPFEVEYRPMKMDGPLTIKEFEPNSNMIQPWLSGKGAISWGRYRISLKNSLLTRWVSGVILIVELQGGVSGTRDSIVLDAEVLPQSETSFLGPAGEYFTISCSPL